MHIEADPSDGLVVVPENVLENTDPDDDDPEDGDPGNGLAIDSDLESLRDELIDAFNARDLDLVLDLVADDVELPHVTGDGPDVLAEELEAIWERSPSAMLTRAFFEGRPCAVAWILDDDAGWDRATLLCFDADDGLITLLEMADDPEALAEVVCEEPDGDEAEEGSTWVEWDAGEEPRAHRQ